MPKISIVIPVHNNQDYLRQSLDSVVRQTLEDIELICVDDHSDDSSQFILEEYAQRDPRVRVITFTENRTASQARKDGVLASTGEYIMFVDADDALERDACEKLYGLLQHDPVDILHFGTEITTEKSLAPERLRWMRRFLRPHEGKLEGSSILEGAFSESRLYNFSLWDKIYSAELCKKSFSRIKDGRFPKAQDKYAYFLLSYHARTYLGVPDEVLYHYHFGRGVTGHNLLSFPQFERYCSMGLVADAIREFLVEEDALPRYEAIYANVRNQLLHDCVANWNGHLGVDEKARGFDLMLRYWDPPEVIAKVASLNWGDQGHVARLLDRSRFTSRASREVRVVGTYYHRYANGGVQRILSILIRLWLSLGYEVVLFTDELPSPDDYDLPEGVRRVVLPSSFEVTPGNFLERALELRKAILEYQIDVMVYHAWVSRILFWDLLTVKTTGAGFITHCHSVFSQPMRNAKPYFADMPFIYRLCDGIIALSEVDRSYWGNFNDNVIAAVNPLTFELDDLKPSSLEGKNVLWMGRMSNEKRPHEALRIFAKVVNEEPDAKLFMVGGSPDQEYMDDLNALVEELGVQESVIICGFCRDVLKYYADASVLLMTSEFEGFPMVLSESQSAGIPCVMYDLPYLTITRPRQGLVAVEMGDIEAASDSVIDLLRDADYRKSMGREARANVEELARFDFAGTWRDVFEGLGEPMERRSVDETTRIMWHTLLDHYRTGAEKRELEVGRVRKSQRRMRDELQRLRASRLFRLCRKVTAVPRRIRAALGSSSDS